MVSEILLAFRSMSLLCLICISDAQFWFLTQCWCAPLCGLFVIYIYIHIYILYMPRTKNCVTCCHLHVFVAECGMVHLKFSNYGHVLGKIWWVFPSWLWFHRVDYYTAYINLQNVLDLGKPLVSSPPPSLYT
jgi:hypothetical protein